jgi:hypothetical protein
MPTSSGPRPSLWSIPGHSWPVSTLLSTLFLKTLATERDRFALLSFVILRQ